jgi:predicted amidohydrolase
MHELLIALASGAVSAGLICAADRFPILAWIALTPLFGVALSYPAPHVACAAALAGAIGTTKVMFDPTQRVLILMTLRVSAVSWAVAYGCVTFVLSHVPVALAVVLLPLGAICAIIPLRLAGAPRWVSNPLARSQERWLSVVHLARLGGDLAVTAILAVPGAALALVLVRPTTQTLAAGFAALAVAGVALLYAKRSLHSAIRLVQAARRVKMAAVVTNVPPPMDGKITGVWASTSPHAADVPGALARYEPQIEQALVEGAELIALPECAVVVDRASRQTWIDAFVERARRDRVAMVVPFCDTSSVENGLVVIDALGRLIGAYQKQHPVLRVEPKRSMRTAPGPFYVQTRSGVVTVSTVICADLDYPDLVGPTRSVGGVLIAPSNDWPELVETHHRSAVWSAVMTGVPVLRPTGHGMSALLDGAGRVIASSNSLSRPVVLVIDVPLASDQSARRE